MGPMILGIKPLVFMMEKGLTDSLLGQTLVRTLWALCQVGSALGWVPRVVPRILSQSSQNPLPSISDWSPHPLPALGGISSHWPAFSKDPVRSVYKGITLPSSTGPSTHPTILFGYKFPAFPCFQLKTRLWWSLYILPLSHMKSALSF